MELDWPLITFIAFIAGLVILVIATLRSAFGQAMLEVAKVHVETYALAYVKCLLLMSLAMISSFKETFHSLTDGLADKWAWWDWVIALSNPIAAAFAVAVAFLDRSAQNAKPPVEPPKTT